MNEKLKEFERANLRAVRANLIAGLAQCTERQQLVFKHGYSHDDLTRSTEEIVDNLPIDELAWAMEQVEATLRKNVKAN